MMMIQVEGVELSTSISSVEYTDVLKHLASTYAEKNIPSEVQLNQLPACHHYHVFERNLIANLRKENEKLHEEVRNMRNQAIEAERSKFKVEVEMNKVKTDLDNHTDRNEEVAEILKNKLKELQEYTNRYDAQQDIFNVERKEYHRKIQMLEQEVNKYKEEIKKMQTPTVNVITCNCQQQVSVQDLEKEQVRAQYFLSQTHQLDKLIKEMETKNNSLDRENKSLRKQFETLQQNMKNVSVELETTKASESECQAKNTKLETKVKRFQQKVRSLEGKVAKLTRLEKAAREAEAQLGLENANPVLTNELVSVQSESHLSGFQNNAKYNRRHSVDANFQSPSRSRHMLSPSPDHDQIEISVSGSEKSRSLSESASPQLLNESPVAGNNGNTILLADQLSSILTDSEDSEYKKHKIFPVRMDLDSYKDYSSKDVNNVQKEARPKLTRNDSSTTRTNFDADTLIPETKQSTRDRQDCLSNAKHKWKQSPSRSSKDVNGDNENNRSSAEQEEQNTSKEHESRSPSRVDFNLAIDLGAQKSYVRQKLKVIHHRKREEQPSFEKEVRSKSRDLQFVIFDAPLADLPQKKLKRSERPRSKSVMAKSSPRILPRI